MKSHNKLFMLFGVIILALSFGLLQSGCRHEDGDNETTTTTVAGDGPDSAGCIPCGTGVNLVCSMCAMTGCPECFEIDEQTNEMKMVYSDGSYYIASADGGEITFYDSSGKQCFKLVISTEDGNTKTTYFGADDEECYEMITDTDGNTVTIIIDDETYAYHADDGTWDCPDGTTWEMDPSCEEADSPESDGPDIGNCPPVTEFCDGTGIMS